MRPEPTEEDHEIQFKLFRETLWNLDDKVSVMRETLVEQAVEIVRLRQLTDLLLEKLDRANLNKYRPVTKRK